MGPKVLETSVTRLIWPFFKKIGVLRGDSSLTHGHELKLNEARWLHRCWWRMLETKYVGDKIWMLVTSHLVFCTNIKYQSPTSRSGVLWWWWPMLVPRDLFKDGKIHWIWHRVELYVSNITYQRATSYSAIFSSLPPTFTCLDRSQLRGFLKQCNLATLVFT